MSLNVKLVEKNNLEVKKAKLLAEIAKIDEALDGKNAEIATLIKLDEMDPGTCIMGTIESTGHDLPVEQIWEQVLNLYNCKVIMPNTAKAFVAAYDCDEINAVDYAPPLIGTIRLRFMDPQVFTVNKAHWEAIACDNGRRKKRVVFRKL